MKNLLIIIFVTLLTSSFSQTTGTLNVSTTGIQGKWYLDKVNLLETQNFDKCGNLIVETVVSKPKSDRSFNPTNVTFKSDKLKVDTYPKNARRNRHTTIFYLEQYTTVGECNEKPHYLTNELCNNKFCLLSELNGATYFYGKDKFIVVSPDKQIGYVFNRRK